MISIIVSSKTQKLFKDLSSNIFETIGVKYEIIKIDNPGIMGICKAYNIGANKAKYDLLCFCHEDISFRTKNWGQNLISHFENRDVSLIGVLGNIIKTKIPAGVYSGIQNTNRIHQVQRMPNNAILNYYTNPLNEHISEVVTLDGMFLATKKEFWTKDPFDDNTLKGFHGYDVDFSLSMAKHGKVVVVYDILFEHFSSGKYTRDWVESHHSIIKKWKQIFPIYTSNVDKKTIEKHEIDDLIQYILVLSRVKIEPLIILNYAIKLFMKAPFHHFNLSVLKILTLRLLGK